jgi:hypothetical protein
MLQVGAKQTVVFKANCSRFFNDQFSIQEILHQENHFKTTAKDPLVPGPI